MKLKNLALIASMSVLTIGLTGCFEDSDTTDASITLNGASTVKAGNSIPLTGGIEGSGAISDVDFTFASEGLSDDQLDLVGITATGEPEEGATEVDFEDFSLSITTEKEACNGAYVLTAKATIDGSTITKPFNFTVSGGVDCEISSGTELAAAKQDTIYNVKGPKKGAYDLKTGTQIGASGDAAVKDLKDMSVAASDDDMFSMELTSGNGAMFAVVTDLTFATVTDADLAASAAKATFVANSGTLKAGDVVIVKLSADRGASLVVVKVITAQDDKVGDNSGFIAFEYKM